MNNEVWELVLEVFGSENDAEYWLYNKTLKQFGGLSPYQMCVQGGEQEVMDILVGLDHGVW